MTEEQIDEMVRELQNSPVELWDFVSRNLDGAETSEIDALVDDYKSSYLDLREFVINSLNK
ncbi:hypothetical protein [Bacillus toyonensis]|uniref:hypothetical protein n=1 Tax=Bacillus toyonensis TaxID=155322 RepID=UPI002E1D16D7|nr:hypothetical protein [Bacillus toyonensis]